MCSIAGSVPSSAQRRTSAVPPDLRWPLSPQEEEGSAPGSRCSWGRVSARRGCARRTAVWRDVGTQPGQGVGRGHPLRLPRETRLPRGRGDPVPPNRTLMKPPPEAYWSLTPSLTHSLTHSLIHSFIHPFTYSFIHSFIYSFIHSFIHPLNKCLFPDTVEVNTEMNQSPHPPDWGPACPCPSATTARSPREDTMA